MKPISEFINEEIEGEPYVIAPELLPTKGKLFIAAPEKHNKSFALLAMGVSMASGTPIWGNPAFTVQRRFKVGYFDQELGRHRLQKRIRSIMEHTETDPVRDEMFWVEPRNRSLRFDRQEGMQAIEKLIVENGIEVSLFDPISKFYPSFNENDTQSMSILVLALDTLIERTGTTLVFAHHMPKPSEVQRRGAQRMRGSTVLGADLDTYIELVRISPEHHKNQVMFASFVTRDAPVDPFYIKRTEYGLIEYVGTENPMKERARMGGEARANRLHKSPYDFSI